MIFKSLNFRKKPFYISELFLGLGLGTGYLTSLRFTDSFGISEIFYVCYFIFLIMGFGSKLLTFKRDVFGLFSIYFLISALLVAPILTSIVNFYLLDVVGSSPKYIISFAFSSILYLITYNAIILGKLNMQIVAVVFFISFISINLLFGSPYEHLSVEVVGRYNGGANNPNQLGFYGTTLLLMLLMYTNRMKIISILMVCAIVMLSQSDSFLLSVFVLIISYIFLLTFDFPKLPRIENINLYIFLIILSVSFAILFYGDIILEIWEKADEGDARISLYRNGIEAVLLSPIFGLGIGSFAGLNSPLEGWEAHNTFLDLAMQFGIILPCLIYLILFAAIYDSIRDRRFIFSSFLLAFVVNSLFHFSARHFNFWIELAVISSYIYFNSKKRCRNKITLG